MKKHRIVQTLVFLACCLSSMVTVAEDVVVVMHPSFEGEMTEKSISEIFLMKVKSFPNGQLSIPLDVDDDEGLNRFYKLYTNKSPSQVKAYWARFVFTGKGSPPKKVYDDEEVLELVSKNPNIIGYVSAESLDQEEYPVKVVAKKSM